MPDVLAHPIWGKRTYFHSEIAGYGLISRLGRSCGGRHTGDPCWAAALIGAVPFCFVFFSPTAFPPPVLKALTKETPLTSFPESDADVKAPDTG